MTIVIKGTIEHVRFYNEGSQYAVLVVRPKDAPADELTPEGTITVVGTMPRRPRPADLAGFAGYFHDDAKYGRQFKSLEAKLQKPAKKPVPSAPPADTGSSHPTDSDTPQQQSFIPEEENDSDTLQGSVERVTFYNPENGWGVVKVTPSGEYPGDARNRDGTIAVVGVMPELMQGEFAEFIGRWVTNDQYGKQFKAEQVIPSAPSSREGVVRYIADTVFGVGDVTAGRIYDHFGAKTVETLDAEPERIHEVPGLKSNLAENFLEAWGENRAERRVMIQLQAWGISSRLARKIYDEYGNQTLRVIENDPYHLADDVHGIGFKRADGIARGMGIETDAPQRLRAGLVYALSRLANDGHTFSPRDMLLEKARELLGVDNRGDLDLNAELDEQILRGKLKKDTLYLDGSQGQPTEAIYLPIFYNSETGAAERLRQISSTPSKIIFRTKANEWIKYLAELAEQNNVELSDQQQSAVKAVLTDKVSVLTGGPGTGKTTTLRMVINALDQEGFSYLLASPTGRAAKRLSEATGRDASTIHRMLGWTGEGGFDFNEDNPLDIDALIIDEASMIDLILFYNLLKALAPATHLLLVGDVDQLPSVGAGNVLNDVIDSGIAHVTRLTQIFRQDDESHIVTNAHRINQGEMPVMDNRSSDFFFFNISDPEEANEMIVEIVKTRLQKKLGEYDRFNDVQVIAPMYRGAIGVNALNAALQQRLNPPTARKAEKKFGGKIFRKGDKVMQTSNNYEKDVFNGDIGIVYAIDDDENTIHVMMDSNKVDYDYKDADEQLIHAYCISTHRSQGSEYPVVVMPLMTQHYIMLQRNLLYTAITRAKRMVVLVGTRRAMRLAINNNQVAERYTAFKVRLQSGADRTANPAL